jgi:hypothetical protein
MASFGEAMAALTARSQEARPFPALEQALDEEKWVAWQELDWKAQSLELGLSTPSFAMSRRVASTAMTSR